MAARMLCRTAGAPKAAAAARASWEMPWSACATIGGSGSSVGATGREVSSHAVSARAAAMRNRLVYPMLLLLGGVFRAPAPSVRPGAGSVRPARARTSCYSGRQPRFPEGFPRRRRRADPARQVKRSLVYGRVRSASTATAGAVTAAMAGIWPRFRAWAWRSGERGRQSRAGGWTRRTDQQSPRPPARERGRRRAQRRSMPARAGRRSRHWPRRRLVSSGRLWPGPAGTSRRRQGS